MSLSFRHSTSALLAVMLFAFSGCGERLLPVVPVSGKVLVKGQPAAGAQVVLHPVSADPEQVFSASGKVQDDGTFKIGLHTADDGAPPGEYVATVQWFKLVQTEGGAGPGPNVVAQEFGDPKRSPLKVTVKNESTELAPFEVR